MNYSVIRFKERKLTMKFCHEYKHKISKQDFLTIQQNLSTVAQLDQHAINDTYMIRSLYFDNIYDKAFREKIDGVNCPERFQIRYYNRDTFIINLEKKSKINGLCNKETAPLSAKQTHQIICGNLDWMLESKYSLVIELYSIIKSQGLQPATIVDCTRISYVYGSGNIRVTLDYDLRTGLRGLDFLNPYSVTIPVKNDPIILDIKWDEFLPDTIKHACELPGRHTVTFSKYEMC